MGSQFERYRTKVIDKYKGTESRIPISVSLTVDNEVNVDHHFVWQS
jgi:hypothetical protein